MDIANGDDTRSAMGLRADWSGAMDSTGWIERALRNLTDD